MVLALAAAALAACLNGADQRPAVAIVIDDLGNRAELDRAALELPAAVSYGVLPFAPLTRELARGAQGLDRDVLLHLPMEAHSNNHLLGPGALMMDMPRGEFIAAVQRALTDVPHVVGVNNHMGSRMTADAERMGWLMQALRMHGPLLFLDSRTTSASAARPAARQSDVSYLRRDVFLDNRRGAAAINARLDELFALARTRGDAVGIGHPHAETLAVLAARLPALAGIRVVAITELLRLRECRAAAVARPTLSVVAPERGDDHRGTEAAEQPHHDR